ncbi:hypothetical protein J6590_033462 [Homalodisca vitripennis]|nr:hypothetical protein J6590_033462 [Homalodisca vitripennis]
MATIGGIATCTSRYHQKRQRPVEMCMYHDHYWWNRYVYVTVSPETPKACRNVYVPWPLLVESLRVRHGITRHAKGLSKCVCTMATIGGIATCTSRYHQKRQRPVEMCMYHDHYWWNRYVYVTVSPDTPKACRNVYVPWPLLVESLRVRHGITRNAKGLSKCVCTMATISGIATCTSRYHQARQRPVEMCMYHGHYWWNRYVYVTVSPKTPKASRNVYVPWPLLVESLRVRHGITRRQRPVERCMYHGHYWWNRYVYVTVSPDTPKACRNVYVPWPLLVESLRVRHGITRHAKGLSKCVCTMATIVGIATCTSRYHQTRQRPVEMCMYHGHYWWNRDVCVTVSPDTPKACRNVYVPWPLLVESRRVCHGITRHAKALSKCPIYISIQLKVPVGHANTVTIRPGFSGTVRIPELSPGVLEESRNHSSLTDAPMRLLENSAEIACGKLLNPASRRGYCVVD